MSNTAGRVANKGDTDRTPRSVASDLGLHRVLRPVSPNTYSVSILLKSIMDWYRPDNGPV